MSKKTIEINLGVYCPVLHVREQEPTTVVVSDFVEGEQESIVCADHLDGTPKIKDEGSDGYLGQWGPYTIFCKGCSLNPGGFSAEIQIPQNKSREKN